MIQDLRQGQGYSCYFGEKMVYHPLVPIFMSPFQFNFHTNMSKHINHLVKLIVEAFITFSDCLVVGYLFNQRMDLLQNCM